MSVARRPVTAERALRSFLELTHPLPVLMTVAASGFFALAASHGAVTADEMVRVLGALALSQISIAVFNDVCDVDLDREGHPNRPLPRGALGLTSGRLLVLLAGLASIAIAGTFGLLSTILVFTGTASGLAYSLWFKWSRLSWLPFALAFPLLPAWECLLFHNHVSMLWTFWLIGAPVAVAIHLADSLPDIDTDTLHPAANVVITLGRSRAAGLCRLLVVGGAILSIGLSPLASHPLIAMVGGLLAIGISAVMRTSDVWSARGRYLVALSGISIGAGWIASLAL